MTDRISGGARLLLVTTMIAAVNAAGCGEESKEIPPPPPSCVDVSGVWWTDERIDARDCGDGIEAVEHRYTVSQNGCDVSVRDEFGGLYQGGITEDRVTWTGSYREGEGVTTLDSLELRVSGNTLSGSGSWTWLSDDGFESCSGTSSIEGVRGPIVDPAPVAPRDLEASPHSSSSAMVVLTWSDESSNETGFVIQRSATSGGSGFETVATAGSGVERFELGGHTASTTYWYRVAARNADGLSAYSNVASTRTLDPAPSPPSAPSGLAIGARTTSSLTLTWRDNSNTEDGYEVFETSPGGSPTRLVRRLEADATRLTVQGLAAGRTYWFAVRAYNAAGPSGYSRPVSGTTSEAPVPPSAPSFVRVSNVTAEGVRIGWRDNSSNESGFRIGTCPGLVEIWSDGRISCAGELSVLRQVGKDVQFADVTGLLSGTDYVLYVEAFNGAGESKAFGASFTTKSSRALRIINGFSGGGGNRIMQLRIAPTAQLATSDAYERLSPDDYFARFPGDSIDPGESRTFDLDGVGEDYSVFVATGLWDIDNSWFRKKTWTVDPSFRPIWIFRIIGIADHVAGVATLRTYYAGDAVVIRLEDGSRVLGTWNFNVSYSDPTTP